MGYLDTPPRWAGADTAARVAASAADLMVVPVRPSFVDLEATVAALERIQAVTAARVVAVLNGCATRGSDAADAEQALVDRGVLAEGAVKETGAEWVGSVVEEPEQFRISLRREDGPPNPRVASPYADWGKCELCGVEVPPTGARIGFFGKTDVYPRWCRVCVEASGDLELLETWDARVMAEHHRRRSLK